MIFDTNAFLIYPKVYLPQDGGDTYGASDEYT